MSHMPCLSNVYERYVMHISSHFSIFFSLAEGSCVKKETQFEEEFLFREIHLDEHFDEHFESINE